VIATEHEAFYAEFTSRNRGLISEEEQRKLRNTRFVIAGCGSTGGACIMPLVRSGAERFVLLDPGAYEVSNLNRQDAMLSDVGKNKAQATLDRIIAVNPFASAEAHPQGVRPDEVDEVLQEQDLVIDAVDVTTSEGVAAKLALHEVSCRRRLVVITAYDIGATQYLELFDYRRIRRPLRGRLHPGQSPDAMLRALIPPLVVPREIFRELAARRKEPERPFPQLAMTSTLLGSLIVPYVLRLLMGKPVRPRMHVDLHDIIRPGGERIVEHGRRLVGLAALWWQLRG
jgi:hypothetical protein